MKETFKEVKRIDKELKKGNAIPEQSIPFSRWPMSKWTEWQEDCIKNFNSCRWFKAWSDHLKAQNSAENEELWKKIAELEMRLENLTQKPEEEDTEGVKNLHGEVIGK